MGVVLQQSLHIIHPGVQLHRDPHGLHQLHVVVNGLMGHAELRDDVADDAAQGVSGLEQGDLHPGPGQEEGRGHAAGAAADDGRLFARHGRVRLHLGQEGVKAPLGRLQLLGPDIDALVVGVSHALVLAAVGADGAGDEGQGVAPGDDLQSLLILPGVHRHEVGGDVLFDGTAGPAGGLEAVNEGDLLVRLAAGDGFYGLGVAAGAGDGLHQGLYLVRVHPGPARRAGVHEDAADLAEPLVAAGLEDGGGHGDGPDTRLEQISDGEGVRASGVGDAQPAVKLPGQHPGQGEGQGVQRPAGHVHLLGGQLSRRHVHREGVGDLHAELQALLPAQFLQTAEHGQGVFPLEVLQEVMVIKGDVVVAQAVQGLAGKFVAQKGGVALDIGVQALLGDKVGGDALDLVGGTAVEGGLGDGVGDPGGDGLHKVPIHLLELIQVGRAPVRALLPDLGVGGVLHALDIPVDLLALDTLQVVAHRHIEHKAVRGAQAQLTGEQLAGPPRFDVLGKGLGDGQFRGPLAVVALVGGGDTGLVHALGQLLAVHDLHGLQLEEPGPGGVGGDDVLGQLGVGAGGGAVMD